MSYIPPTGGDLKVIGCVGLTLLLVVLVWIVFLAPPVGPMNPW